MFRKERELELDREQLWQELGKSRSGGGGTGKGPAQGDGQAAQEPFPKHALSP